MLCPMQIGKSLLKLQLLFSCTQKPAKNPMQKLPKNPTKILYAKIFYDFLNKKPAKNFKYIQKLPNFTLNTNKTKNHAPINYTI